MVFISNISKLFLSLPALLFFSTLAQADEPLSLTTTDRHGDCIHSAVSTKKSQLEHTFDKAYCVKWNAEKDAVLAQCIAIKSELEAEPFYHDCGNDQNYIGINGKTYLLKQVGKSPTQQPFLIGSFKSDGIKVQVEKIRLLEREPDVDNAEFYETLKY